MTNAGSPVEFFHSEDCLRCTRWKSDATAGATLKSMYVQFSLAVVNQCRKCTLSVQGDVFPDSHPERLRLASKGHVK